MRNFTDQEILDKVAALPSFDGWRGIIDVWVRAATDPNDIFNDKVFTYNCESGEPKFIMACTGTSHAGFDGLRNYQKYNKNGCAILKSNEICYDSHHRGLHKGKYPAYTENKGFPYFRDTDRDTQLDETGKLYTDVIGANCHHAGNHSTVIFNWSVACLVRNDLAEWNKWFAFMNKRPFLTVAIIKEF